jgi:hypothetical protein
MPLDFNDPTTQLIIGAGLDCFVADFAAIASCGFALDQGC